MVLTQNTAFNVHRLSFIYESGSVKFNRLNQYEEQNNFQITRIKPVDSVVILLSFMFDDQNFFLSIGGWVPFSFVPITSNVTKF